MARPTVCMQCRKVRDGARCSACGDSLLDLANESDRAIVRMAVNAPSAIEVIMFFVVCAVALAGFFFVGARARWLGGVLEVLAIGSFVGTVLAIRAQRRRDWGLAASDLSSDEERSARHRALVEWITGVPLWSAVLVVAVHAARMSSEVFERGLAPLALRLGDLREGVIGPSFLGHALLHSGALHLFFNALGLIVFGHLLTMRVRRAGTLLLLIGGVAGGAIAQSLLWPDPDTNMVGISGGVYAWIAAPAVLDPNLRTILTLRGASIPMPMWLRVALSLILYAGIDALVSAGSIAVFAHLGGALAGIALALPLRRVTPSPSYARWRAAHERTADSV